MDQPCLICGKNHNNLPCPKLRDGLLYDPIPRTDLQLPSPAGFYTKHQLDEAVRAAVEACPVCRSTSYCLSALPGSSHWFVKCLECGTTGPTVHAPGDPFNHARLSWNDWARGVAIRARGETK